MFKRLIITTIANRRKKEIDKWSNNPIKSQEKTLKKLIKAGRQTLFGKAHNFSQINNYEDYKQNIPVVDYEGIKSYINKIMEGHRDVLWPGRPIYFAVTVFPLPTFNTSPNKDLFLETFVIALMTSET